MFMLSKRGYRARQDLYRGRRHGSFIKPAIRCMSHKRRLATRTPPPQQLGRPFFIRNKRVRPYPSGRAIPRFAPAPVQLWQRAKQQVAVPEGHRAVLTIGSEVSLWEPLLVDWVRKMRHSHPDIALRVHVDVPHDLIAHVAAGIADIAVVYAPQH